MTDGTDNPPGEEEVIAEMTPEQLSEAVAAGQTKMRKLVIETDGNSVHVAVNELTHLEVRAVCQLVLRQLGG